MAGFTPYGSGTLRVELWERDRAAGRVLYLGLAGAAERVRCTRELSGMGECDVDIPNPGDPELRRLLAGLRTIRFEIDVWRDNQLVWSGPLTRLRYGRTTTYLTGRDFTWWLGKRFVRQRLAFENEIGADGVEDVAVIARTAVESALAADDVDLARWLVFHEGGQVGMARYELVERVTALEVLDDLTSTGLDYTALGRQLVFWGGGEPIPTLGVLGDADFTDDIEVVEDGDLACTLAAVTGGGIVGEYGGIDSYLGLVEQRYDAGSQVTQFGPLDQAAAQQVAARNPVPLQINLPQPGSLSPLCTVAPQQLIPGAYADIAITGCLRPVTQTMRLQSVEFSRDGVNPEQVSVSFEPVGVLAETGA